MIMVKIELDTFDMLMNYCWSGAIDTLKTIAKNNKVENFMIYYEIMFGVDYGYIPTLTELNDWLWFDRDTIYKDLGIDIDE